MLHCGIDCWEESMKRRDVIDYIYRIISSKKQKGKPCEKDLPLLKNDITNNLEPQKPVIHSRYLESQA